MSTTSAICKLLAYVCKFLLNRFLFSYLSLSWIMFSLPVIYHSHRFSLTDPNFLLCSANSMSFCLCGSLIWLSQRMLRNFRAERVINLLIAWPARGNLGHHFDPFHKEANEGVVKHGLVQVTHSILFRWLRRSHKDWFFFRKLWACEKKDRPNSARF